MKPLIIVNETLSTTKRNGCDGSDVLPFHDTNSPPQLMQLYHENNVTDINVMENESKLPRPRNAFFLYRVDKHNEIMSLYSNFSDAASFNLQQKHISKAVGEMWKQETEEVRQFYELEAEKEAIQHRDKYPFYKYRPEPKKASRRSANQAGNVVTEEEVLNNIFNTDTSTFAEEQEEHFVSPAILPSQCLSQDDISAFINSSDLLAILDQNINSCQFVDSLGDNFFDFCVL